MSREKDSVAVPERNTDVALNASQAREVSRRDASQLADDENANARRVNSAPMSAPGGDASVDTEHLLIEVPENVCKLLLEGVAYRFESLDSAEPVLVVGTVRLGGRFMAAVGTDMIFDPTLWGSGGYVTGARRRLVFSEIGADNTRSNE